MPNTDTSRWALLERIKLKRLTRDDAVLELVSWKSHLNLLSLDGATLVFGMDKNGSFLQLGIAGTSLMVSAFLSIDAQHCLISLRSHWLQQHASQKGVHCAFFHVLT